MEQTARMFINSMYAQRRTIAEALEAANYIESLAESRRSDARRRVLEAVLSGMNHADLMIYLRDHYPLKVRITE